MSGPAIKPIALRCVWDVYDSVRGIPVIGVGGISNYKNICKFLYAGASLVQIGTSIMDYGPEIFKTINTDLKRIYKNSDLLP